MKSKLLVVTFLYATMISASTTENKASLEKRIAKTHARISSLVQHIKSSATANAQQQLKPPNCMTCRGEECSQGCKVCSDCTRNCSKQVQSHL